MKLYGLETSTHVASVTSWCLLPTTVTTALKFSHLSMYDMSLVGFHRGRAAGAFAASLAWWKHFQMNAFFIELYHAFDFFAVNIS